MWDSSGGNVGDILFFSENIYSFSTFVYKGHFNTVGNHVTFYTYIRTERVSIFVIILLKLNEFSYRKAQIPHRFCS